MAKAKMMLTDEEVLYDSLVLDRGLVLVDFYADWCGPCKMMAPILMDVAKNYEDDVLMAKVDVELYDGLASNLLISTIPTMILFKEGKEVKRFIGFTPKSKVENAINENL